MLSTGKRQEYFLRASFSLLFMTCFSLLGWSGFFIGCFLLGLFWILFKFNSTKWILNSLDLGPEIVSLDKFMLKQNSIQLAKKYKVARPSVFLIQNSAPAIFAFGSKDNSYLVVGEEFFYKLSVAERNALLELSFNKLESGFCKNIEFITLTNLLLLNIGSKMDLALAFIVGLKRKNKLTKRFHILFSRISLIFIRLINSFYINKKLFLSFDDYTYQNNPHLLLALKKTLLYSPFERDFIEVLLCPFNFTNFPVYAKWQRPLQVQPKLNERISALQKDKNLMVESLTI